MSERENFEREWVIAFQPELESWYSLRRDNLGFYEKPATAAGWAMWQAARELSAKEIAELNQRIVEQQAYRKRLLALLPELKYARETHVIWRDCEQIHRDANPSIGDAKFHDELVGIYDKRIALMECDDLSALATHDAEKDRQIAELRAALSHIKWIKDCGIDSSQGNHPDDERDAMYKIAEQALSNTGE